MKVIMGRKADGTYREIAVDESGNLIIGTPVPNGAEADQRLTVDDSVRQFAAFHSDTTAIYWTSEAAECRVTFDGSAPTTSNGHVIAAGSSGTWPATTAAVAKFIRTTGVSAVIHASQMK